LRNFFFCDAAEIFVLISGVTTYLAYGSRFDQQGSLSCTKAIAKRWVRVYFAHLLLFGAVAGFVITVSQHFFGANYIDSLKLNWLVESRERALLPVLTLTYLPRLLDILPLYLILLGIAPLLILTVKRDYRIAFLISGAVYATIWFSGWNLKAGEGRDWYFDPFAWQFLYTLGMILCHLSRIAHRKGLCGASTGYGQRSGFWFSLCSSHVWQTALALRASHRCLICGRQTKLSYRPCG
jgi:hypothetical protein